MGCNEVKDPTANLPSLMCIVEPKNENQKNFCLKLKENFNYPNSVKYEIRAYQGSTFNIYLVINGQQQSILTAFNENNENEVNNALQKIYNILDSVGDNSKAMPNVTPSTVPISMPNTIPTNSAIQNPNTAPISLPNSDPNALLNVNPN